MRRCHEALLLLLALNVKRDTHPRWWGVSRSAQQGTAYAWHASAAEKCRATQSGALSEQRPIRSGGAGWGSAGGGAAPATSSGNSVTEDALLDFAPVPHNPGVAVMLVQHGRRSKVDECADLHSGGEFKLWTCDTVTMKLQGRRGPVSGWSMPGPHT
jgi:hypothetical protein